ncbi:MAG: chromosome partitioning protein ParA [Bifidobacterium bifidum]
MNLTPRPRDLTALLNSDRTDTAIPEPVDTEKPNTEKTKNRKDEKPESGEGWVKTSVSLRASTRRRLKAWAAEHDMRIQEVVDAALETYLGLK